MLVELPHPILVSIFNCVCAGEPPSPGLSPTKTHLLMTELSAATRLPCCPSPCLAPIPLVFRSSSRRKPASSWIRSSMFLFPIPKSRRMVREKRRRILHRSPLARATPARISVSGSCLPSPSCVQLCAKQGWGQIMKGLDSGLREAPPNLPGLMARLWFLSYRTLKNRPGLR